MHPLAFAGIALALGFVARVCTRAFFIGIASFDPDTSSKLEWEKWQDVIRPAMIGCASILSVCWPGAIACGLLTFWRLEELFPPGQLAIRLAIAAILILLWFSFVRRCVRLNMTWADRNFELHQLGQPPISWMRTFRNRDRNS